MEDVEMQPTHKRENRCATLAIFKKSSYVFYNKISITLLVSKCLGLTSNPLAKIMTILYSTNYLGVFLPITSNYRNKNISNDIAVGPNTAGANANL